MLNLQNLRSIAEVRSGYTFRGSINDYAEGKTHVLQAKNIIESNKIDYQSLPRIQIEKLRANSFVNSGDVLFSSRGSFKAGVYRGELDNVMASASLYILHVTSNQLLPEYLSIYLNSKRGQSEIQSILTGTIIKAILIKDLEMIRIVVPPLERQQKIIDIYSNWKEREDLLNRKIKFNQQIAEGAINHILTN